ncbi:MAG: D-glycero-beta-D-manno-heptose 1-phosphate adenylyltransferase [Bdellovibrionales bacterium]|jgi:rfaE bifunctional protein nucleotidyltransferase chain/domain|nr:D-glycero-beta-D-manno-heptose 1-phosphate adenylyltransferase [Bdellovibrionales bacterium]
MNRDLQKICENRGNKKIIFTNGCFDILHSGHVQYLNEAKSLGDILVVGLNSDRSVKDLKGPLRPINSEKDRKFILENLKSVDFVEIFDQPTPLELIQNVRPDILVKGGDWKVEQIVGSDFVISHGGLVRSLVFKEGQSTTNIIEKIKEADH